MTHDEKMQALQKGLDTVLAGHPLCEPRDIFPRNEEWHAAVQLSNGRDDGYLLPLLKYATGCTRHSINVEDERLAFTCYWADGEEAGTCDLVRTDRYATDRGRAAICAIMMAMRADLMSTHYASKAAP